jgi:hypothetical protein
MHLFGFGGIGFERPLPLPDDAGQTACD